MLRKQNLFFSIFVVGVAIAAGTIPAQAQSFVMSTPRASQRAAVTQRVGLTDISIHYHRPTVNGRKVWGGIVPLDQVWRAGANENTIIEFSDPVTIEGQPLAKGTYGLHMIPGADSWTIIFSKNSTSWGSFTYDQKEDALRVNVKPQPSDMHEAVTYDFDDLKADSTSITLRWEKLAVPFKVAVDKEVTLGNIRLQLRDLPQYVWMGWEDAATYCADNKVNLDEALTWSTRSVQMEERFENLMTKARILRDLNRSDEAATARNQAIEKGSAQQIYGFGRNLQNTGNQAEGMVFIRAVAKRFPATWTGHLAQARIHSAEGDFVKATAELKASQSTAGFPDQLKSQLDRLLKRLENKEDINKQ